MERISCWVWRCFCVRSKARTQFGVAHLYVVKVLFPLYLGSVAGDQALLLQGSIALEHKYVTFYGICPAGQKPQVSLGLWRDSSMASWTRPLVTSQLGRVDRRFWLQRRL